MKDKGGPQRDESEDNVDLVPSRFIGIRKIFKVLKMVCITVCRT